MTGGTARAQLTATVSIDGIPAGTCTRIKNLRVNGTGSVSCLVASSGPVLQRVEAQKKAMARAQSRASGGRPVPYTINVLGQASVQALARVNVQLLLTELTADLDVLQQLLTRTRTPTRTAPGGGTTQAPAAGEEGEPGPEASRSVQPQPRPSPSGKCPPPPGGARTVGTNWYHNTPASGTGRAETATACVQVPFSAGTSASADPHGYAGDLARAAAWGFRITSSPGLASELARCHLLPSQLGGRGGADARNNLVACFQDDVNVGNPGMRTFEEAVATKLRAQKEWYVIYMVRPEYKDASKTAPEAITMLAEYHDRTGQLVDFAVKTVLNERFRKGHLRNLGDW